MKQSSLGIITMSSQKTVAVITSTIGRAELERAILSVQNQDYPCRHYIFVDGEQHHERARAILDKFPHVCAVYLPMNTGSNGWTNSSINAIAPFLVFEDYICYLDDDNYYEPHHVSDIVSTFASKDTDMVYALRNMIDRQGDYLCRDMIESLGWKSHQSKDGNDKVMPFNINLTDGNTTNTLAIGIRLTDGKHIDTNCMAFKLHKARMIAPAWRIDKKNDRVVFQVCQNYNFTHACTNRFSVNYLMEPKVAWEPIYHKLLQHLSANHVEQLLKHMIPAFYENNAIDITQDDGNWERLKKFPS